MPGPRVPVFRRAEIGEGVIALAGDSACAPIARMGREVPAVAVGAPVDREPPRPWAAQESLAASASMRLS